MPLDMIFIVRAPSNVAPTLTNFMADHSVSPLAATFDLTSTSGLADLYTVLFPNRSTAPSASEIIAGEVAGGGAPSDMLAESGVFRPNSMGHNFVVQDREITIDSSGI